MANDSVRRPFFRAQPAKHASQAQSLAAQAFAPKAFPLLRYAIEYGLTIMVVTVFIALLMNRLAVLLLHLIIVPGWPGPGAG